MKITNCIINETGLTTILGGVPYIVSNDHPKYNEILQAVKVKDGDKFVQLYSQHNKPVIQGKGDFKLNESLVVGYGAVTWRGQEIRNCIAERLVELQRDGHDVGPISKFLEKSLSLSNENAEALFKFIESKGLPIDEDGDFLAWKVVRADYKDKHTGKVDNTPGTTVPEIPRALCDSNRAVACSLGYHVGNLTYSGPNGSFYSSYANDKIVLVKVNPANVVSTPSDVTQNKIRVTQYTVLEDYKPDIMPEMTKAFRSVNPAFKKTIQDLVHGDKISFTHTPNSTYKYSSNDYTMKFEGISKRQKGNFYGRLLSETKNGEPGRSISLSISGVSNLKVL